MRLRVLGCSGGIGGGSHTVAVLLGENVLINIGTLALKGLLKIDYIFVAHSHLDHIVFISFLVEIAGSLCD